MANLPRRIFLYGVPGAGKSTLAKALAKKLEYEYIELGKVRPNTQQYVSREEEPFLYEYTTEAWKKFGELNKENAVKGFLAVRAAVTKYVMEELAEHEGSFVAEAVYVNPAISNTPDTQGVLIAIPDKLQHYGQFFVHRTISDEEDTQFQAARYIHSFLYEEAGKLGVPILMNRGGIDYTVEELEDILK